MAARRHDEQKGFLAEFFRRKITEHRLCWEHQAGLDHAPLKSSYLIVRLPENVRASGFFGVQSSGGNATRQNVGRGAVNSRPISALPLRTGPRNATSHSCSSSVLLCSMSTAPPPTTRTASNHTAP